MSKFDDFAKLHVPGDPLVLFNAWDAGSAAAVAKSGAKAIASGSASVSMAAPQHRRSARRARRWWLAMASEQCRASFPPWVRPGSSLFLERLLTLLLQRGQRHQDQEDDGDDEQAKAERPGDEPGRIAAR